MTVTPDELAAEQARAELWRAQRARRLAYQQALWWQIAGDPVARADLDARWRAVTDWLLESGEPWTAPEDDPDYDPMGMSDTVNVGRMNE